MRTLLIVMLVVSGLGGCADSGAGDETTDDVFDDFDDKPLGTGLGRIRGVVLSDTYTPVEGAKVTVQGLGATTTTNVDGAFVFNDLEPGTYFLVASKVGWTESQATAAVEADVAAPPVVKIQIVHVPGTEPFVVPALYTGFVSCGFQVGNRLFNASYCDPAGLFFGTDDSLVFFPVNPQPATFLQSELDWTANQPGGDRLTLTTYTCSDEACDRSPEGGQRMCQVWGSAPHVCRVSTTEGTGNPDGTGGGDGLNATGFGTGTNPGFKAEIAADCTSYACVPGTALGVGIILEQEYAIFNHMFYNFEPDAEWQFTVDGEPPVPGS